MVGHLTAWRMLFTKAQLKPWETVLVFGIGGGVSLAALQLARAMGAKVIVTAGAAGICRVIVERFLNEGAKIATCDIDAAALKSLPELALAD